VNSIFWDNEQPPVFDSEASGTVMRYSRIEWPGTGNMLEPPAFRDPNTYDFRLERTSPCIDAGTAVLVDQDLDGNRRPWDCPWIADRAESAFDMGAYEFSPVPAELRIVPKTLNCKRQSEAIKAFLVIPKETAAEGFNADEPVLVMADGFSLTAELVRVDESKKSVVVTLSIDRDGLCGLVDDPKTLTLSVTGLLTDGRLFSGTDTVRILKP